jgi:Zn-dependent protease/CBS domain-containing protein
MLWSLRVATIAGTVVRVHVTFVIFLVWIAAGQWRAGGREAALDGVMFILLVFACVLAHEFGHIFAARRYGIRTPDVTLWPIGGVASLERIPQKPSEELIVALAGPAVNVVIAAMLLLILGASFDGTAMDLDNGRTSLAARLAATNIFLVLFNLIPAFPMDGGRVLRAVLAMRMGRANATRVAARIGQAAAFVFALAGLFVNPMLIVIGLFVYLAASAEAQHVAFQDGTHELSVREAMVSPIDALSPGATLDEAIDLLIRTSQKEFPVVDAQSRPRGLLTKDAIIRALRDGGPATPVVDVMAVVPSMPQWRPLDAGLIALNQSKAPALCIVDDAGRLVGLLTPENVGEMMLVRSVRPDFRFRRRRIAA